MGEKQIRVGQLIAPFGPGSLYTDRRGTPHIVAGLDHWFKRVDPVKGLVPCEDMSEFELFEPRLADLLHVNRFCSPPDFRSVRRGDTPPPNARLLIPAHRFPRWYRNSRTGVMKRFNLGTQRLDKPVGGGRWVPVRFVAVCEGGHLAEFPWKQWAGCNCPGAESLMLTDRGGAELSSITVRCTVCKEERTLSGTTRLPEQGERSAFEAANITCPGERPWLGQDSAETEKCNRAFVAALINQTNIYFPRTISAIYLPDLQQADERLARLRSAIEADPGACALAKTLWDIPGRRAFAIAIVRTSLDSRGESVDDLSIEHALSSLFKRTASLVVGAPPAEPESSLSTFRRAEFHVLRGGIDEPSKFPDLRVVPSTPSVSLRSWIARINLVERLRETRVFYGFDRLKPSANAITGMPESAMQQLFLRPMVNQEDRWLPAIAVFGEGIYIELSEPAIASWLKDNDDWLKRRVSDPFIRRLGDVFQTLPPSGTWTREWASRYLLVHSLAHILINQLVFECGYSTASLRERLYVSSDPVAPMAAFLIYTSAGDAEGTLGGLVRLGRPDRFEPVLRRAVSRAAWCSADPICSENLGGTGSRLANLAACHACTLLPETSCETINQGLDRAVIVGTPDAREHGLFAALLEDMYSLYA